MKSFLPNDPNDRTAFIISCVAAIFAIVFGVVMANVNKHERAVAQQKTHASTPAEKQKLKREPPDPRLGDR